MHDGMSMSARVGRLNAATDLARKRHAATSTSGYSRMLSKMTGPSRKH
jgi:hypothetical protein